MAENNYHYPLDSDWTKEELLIVMNLWQAVEKTYEHGLLQETFMTSYQAFKKVVPAIGEEKRLGKAFEASSGYSLYHVVKKAKEIAPNKVIKMP